MSVSHLVRAQLDNLIDPGAAVAPDEVASHCSALLDELLNILQRIVCEELKSYANQHGQVMMLDTDQMTFSLDGIAYVLKVLEDPQDNFILWVTLTSSGLAEPEASMSCQETDLGYAGPYRKLKLRTGGKLSHLAPRLSEIVQEALAAGTKAIEAYAMRQLAVYRNDFVEELYLLLARPFNSDIRQYLYLYVICPKVGGGIVMDSFARQLSLNKLRRARYSLSRSPVELLCQVLEARFSVEQCVGREIVPEMRTYECSPLSIPSAAKVGITQSVLFGNCNIVLHPLVYSEHIWVEAAYPAMLRDLVEKTLLQEQGSFRIVVKKFEDRGYYNLWGSKNTSEITQKVGSLLGSFVGSYLKHSSLASGKRPSEGRAPRPWTGRHRTPPSS